MGEKVSVRALREDDLVWASDLTSQLGYSGTVDQLRARLQRILGRPEQALFVGERAGIVAGWLHAQAQHPFESEPFVEITGLVVAAEHRRAGVGRALVERAYHWAGELGYARLLVRSNVQRDESHPFYRSLGFRLRKTQHAYELVVGGQRH
jgi:ribosomal protein S18 acetylase RimI-like enzyme